MMVYLEFEKPVAALEARIIELQDAARESDVDVSAEIGKLRAKADKQLKDTYANLTAWQKTQVARHPERPHFKDFIASIFEDFMPLAGDRAFGDDQAIIGGLARLNGRRVMVIGHEKGDDTQSRLRHNFGMGKPEGYRKAIRLMELADRFGIPVVSLVDTSGAFPGIQAEERGQAEAIARSTEKCLALGVPMIACIVGEGGSGGAVALAAADRVLMFEYAVYSVISPEGCASILWRTGDDLKALRIIDRIVKEPMGGAHRDHALAAASLGKAIDEEIAALSAFSSKELLQQRRAKFLAMGA
jgi:acetyl-CoA carboxylase carboxyl transferase subunit alpha